MKEFTQRVPLVHQDFEINFLEKLGSNWYEYFEKEVNLLFSHMSSDSLFGWLCTLKSGNELDYFNHCPFCELSNHDKMLLVEEMLVAKRVEEDEVFKIKFKINQIYLNAVKDLKWLEELFIANDEITESILWTLTEDMRNKFDSVVLDNTDFRFGREKVPVAPNNLDYEESGWLLTSKGEKRARELYYSIFPEDYFEYPEFITSIYYN